MEIRYINSLDDRMAISRIYEECWKYAYKDIMPEEYLNLIEEGKWSSVLDLPGWQTLVCVEDGKYVGTSSFCESRFSDYKNYGEIISIYLLPQYIGKGYGKKLFSRVMDELYKQGYDKIFLWVFKDNIIAKKFYKKYGFLETDNFIEENFGGKQLRAVMFVHYRYK